MPLLMDTAEGQKPVYSPELICHHPTSNNPEVLKGFALAMLSGEGYYRAEDQEMYEEVLTNEHILLTTLIDADHTGIAVVTTSSPVEYAVPVDGSSGDIEHKQISLFVTVSVAEDETNLEGILNIIQSWDDDSLLIDRIGQASFEDLWANLSGEKHLPSVAKEYLYHKFTVTSDTSTVRHFGQQCAAVMKKLDCKVELRNISKRSKFVNGKSFTNLLSLMMAKGHEIEMRVLGTDSDKATLALQEAIVKARRSKSRTLGHR